MVEMRHMIFLILVSYVHGSSCPEKCDCTESTMICTGITEFPNLDKMPATITQFHFQDCQLINTSIPHLTYYNAKILTVTNCGITRIGMDTFSSMMNLAHLTISNNQIKALDVGVFKGLDSLLKLDLSYNSLGLLKDGIFQHNTLLSSIDLGHNGITSENGYLDIESAVFAGLNLSYLSLGNCGLKSIPRSYLASVPSLQELDLSHNSFEEIQDGSFSYLPSLSSLSLDSCKIEKISNQAFSGLFSLQLLNVGYNKLESYSPEHTQPFRAAIENVYLENNWLQSLAEETFPWDQMKEVRIYGNPWFCNCDIQWMHKLHPIHDTTHEDTECSGPVKYKNQGLINVTASMQCQAASSASGDIALAFLIPLLILCLALIAYYMYRIRQNRRRRALMMQQYNVSAHAIYRDTVETSKDPIN